MVVTQCMSELILISKSMHDGVYVLMSRFHPIGPLLYWLASFPLLSIM